MQLKQLPVEFESALPVIKTLEEAGYEAYFVGGSVRDTLLQKPIHDVDIATSAYPNEIKELFQKTIDTGIEHGTVMVLDHGNGYEITTFRTESTYTDFRRPDEVQFVRQLDDDLKRRDFTVNALALKSDGSVVDLFDGLSDLQHKLLRAVGSADERFNEDALRMMRAVRFAAQLDFNLDPETKVAIHNNAALLKNISVERINVEFTKLLQGKNAQFGLLALLSTGLNEYMPGLKHTEIDLWGYAELLAVDQAHTDGEAWTLLAFELGLTAADVKDFLKLWKHSNEMIQIIQRSLRLLNQLRLDNVTNWQLYETGTAIENALAVLKLSELTIDPEKLRQRYQDLTIHQRNDLKLNGQTLKQQLKLAPGPLLGQLLKKLEQAVVAGQVVNDEASLIQAAEEYLQKHPSV
ncbi:CCA tRNA nucleotidyltransferase [Weissella coleopterorum]|uniref:CCA-adding enzyme n=1 Tax=Weissella coleopterorum TaxID=2714949 RepID=A0A6G8B0P8_9LACO|nr:CCA tRNA nucleotidyltransferase [Weissella coleopterorum]QIL50884.1 CCA tRNA nucleotidyltransferase [Weissella coleopterorum]